MRERDSRNIMRGEGQRKREREAKGARQREGREQTGKKTGEGR